jgi:hypothetical protein
MRRFVIEWLVLRNSRRREMRGRDRHPHVSATMVAVLAEYSHPTGFWPDKT